MTGLLWGICVLSEILILFMAASSRSLLHFGRWCLEMPFPWLVGTQLLLLFSPWGKNCPRSWWKARAWSPAPSEGLDVSRRH